MGYSYEDYSWILANKKAKTVSSMNQDELQASLCEAIDIIEKLTDQVAEVNEITGCYTSGNATKFRKMIEEL